MAKKNVDHPIDFGISAAHGLESSSAGVSRQITSKALERVAFRLEEITNHEGLCPGIAPGTTKDELPRRALRPLGPSP